MSGVIKSMTINIKLGDIIKEKVDAIVNAAHEYLLGGGGVDGAIHRAAGSGLVQECMQLPTRKDEFGDRIRCDTGEAVITKGYNLPTKHVIHTVGPRCVNGIANEDRCAKLYSCWYNSLKLADDNNLKTISFPSIATGAFLFPINKAAEIAKSAIMDFGKISKSLKEINIVCFSDSDKTAYEQGFAEKTI